MNISEQRRKEMLMFLDEIKKEHDDEKSLRAINIIKNFVTEKKYGLIWEEHSEKVDEILKENIITFTEVETKKIIDDEKNAFNFLLEGDNLHSLKLLEKTHKERIDVIYIDPPYNTKNKEFMYDDCYIDYEDGYRHSKWLSFMSKRLELGKKLLKKEGIIIISIDDNEQAQLKILCDSIFGEENFIANLPTIMNYKGNQSQFGFAGTHEYTLVYSKDINFCQFNEFDLDEEEIESSWFEDDIGYFKRGATIKRTGIDAPREKRPTTFYPILVKDEKIETIDMKEYEQIFDGENKTFDDSFLKKLKEKYEKEGFSFILPIIDDYYASWRWSITTLNENKDDLIIVRNKDNINFYKKQRPELGQIPTRKPKTIFYKAKYSTGTGTKELKDILGGKKFDNPKPIELIKDLICLTSKKDSIILDFFAGSGTTGQAVQKLNKEDGGRRTYILCTNNENEICEKVTYKRLTNIQKELPHNLKYYKTDFIPKINKEDESIKDQMLETIKTLIELENHIEIDNIHNIIINDEELLKDHLNNALDGINIYITSDIMLSQEEKAIADRKNIKLIEIPEYYYSSELREVGEI